MALLGALMGVVSAGPSRSQALSSRLVAAGFEHPSHVAFAPGDRSRMFVVELRARRIRVVRNGTLLPTPFLDLGPSLSDERESGLNSVAFHPDYGRNGRFYVNYTDETRTTYVRGFTVGADPDVADPTTGATIFGPLAQPFGDHHGGGLVFGPDGMLWLALGDGGGLSDPDNRAQDLTTVLGKLLRLDVDQPPSFLPPDNPYAGPENDPQGTIPDEIWARGLRNPWRYSFDRLTGELYVADVGLDAWEEISVQPAASAGGENYGWRCLEGARCTGLSGCACADPLLTPPIHVYDHAQGCAIIGGFVYRGSFLDGLQGTYFFADYCRGRVWSLRYSGGAVSELVERTAELAPAGESSLGRISSFGEDTDGELYIADILHGRVFRIESACPPRESYCRTAPNGFGAGARMGSSGTSSVFLDDLVLSTAGLPPGATGVYFRGRTPAQIPFGHGFLCIEAPAVRFGAVLSTGQASHAFENQHVPAVRPGETWHFQLLYRNGELGPPAFNLSDGLSVPFCP